MSSRSSWPPAAVAGAWPSRPLRRGCGAAAGAADWRVGAAAGAEICGSAFWGADEAGAAEAFAAGFADLPRKVEAPPRRVYLAELDPLFPLEATRASVDAASRRGEAIELVVVPNEGHTLVVGEVVDQAVEWLVARTPRTTASTPPTQSAPSTSPMNTPVPAPADSDARPSAGPRK